MNDFEWSDEEYRFTPSEWASVVDESTRLMAQVTDTPKLDVQEFSYSVPVSDEMAMDLGLIPDTRPKPHYSWRLRFRWWRADQRERFAQWAYGRLAGQDFPGPYVY